MISSKKVDNLFEEFDEFLNKVRKIKNELLDSFFTLKRINRNQSKSFPIPKQKKKICPYLENLIKAIQKNFEVRFIALSNEFDTLLSNFFLL